jgi:hypothetical protein
MKNLYSKDECVPDALSVVAWARQRGIEWTHQIKIDIGDTTYEFFSAMQPRVFYVAVFSCGKFEDIYQSESLEEWKSEIQKKIDSFLKDAV